jgi:hypothetical protein
VAFVYRAEVWRPHFAARNEVNTSAADVAQINVRPHLAEDVEQRLPAAPVRPLARDEMDCSAVPDVAPRRVI